MATFETEQVHAQAMQALHVPGSQGNSNICPIIHPHSAHQVREPELLRHQVLAADATGAASSSRDLPSLFDERGRFDVKKAYPQVPPKHCLTAWPSVYQLAQPASMWRRI
jgi:Zn-dependent alcohol dehydrogenase